MKTLTIKASADGLDLAVAVCAPETPAKGLVQIVHGMAEHKERYYEFMEFLASNGYVAVVSDLRGHGESVKSEDDLGYLYGGGWLAMVEDISHPRLGPTGISGLPVTLLATAGSLIARSFAKRYDDSIQRLLPCGSPFGQSHEGRRTCPRRSDRSRPRQPSPLEDAEQPDFRLLQQVFQGLRSLRLAQQGC